MNELMIQDGGALAIRDSDKIRIIEVPTVHMIINEITIAGSLIGNYTELVELMELNAEGPVNMYAQQCSLDNINAAITDFKSRRIVGRNVIVP